MCRKKDIQKDILEDLYSKQKCTLDCISKMLGCNIKTVGNYINKFGIKRRGKVKRISKAIKNYCINCGRGLKNKTAKRCSECFHTLNSGKNHYNYIDGRSCWENTCVDCGVSLKRNRNKRCIPCNNIYLGKLSLGRKMPAWFSEKMRELRSGKNNPMYGKFGEKADHYVNGKPKCIDCGKELSHYSEGRCGECYRKWAIGPNAPCYINGSTPIYEGIRKLKEYNDWRKAIRDRDNYTCQVCGDSQGGNLEVHHIKSYAVILSEFLYKYRQFSIIEDKETLIRLSISYEPFWFLDNGQTLCVDCHKKTDSYGSGSYNFQEEPNV